MRGRQRWVLVLAALLGIAGGVVTAVLAPGDSGRDGGGAVVNDPLRLGLAQVSLPSCTDEAVLVLGSGDSAASLTPVASDAGDGARYLRTDESCETTWSGDDDVPTYVVYRGPYDSEAEPCRISLDGDGGPVTNLSSGNEELVMCACVLPTAELLGITPPSSAATDPAPVPWVRMLQQLLDVEPTGVYDDATLAAVRGFQRDHAILPPDGKVGERTWGTLREQECGRFSF